MRRHALLIVLAAAIAACNGSTPSITSAPANTTAATLDLSSECDPGLDLIRLSDVTAYWDPNEPGYPLVLGRWPIYMTFSRHHPACTEPLRIKLYAFANTGITDVDIVNGEYGKPMLIGIDNNPVFSPDGYLLYGHVDALPIDHPTMRNGFRTLFKVEVYGHGLMETFHTSSDIGAVGTVNFPSHRGPGGKGNNAD